MNERLTELVFILDASGSMHGLEADTIGGFNSLIDRQRDEEGTALVSTVTFADASRVLHDRIDLRDVPAMTPHDYETGGSTALLDAIGGAIRHIKNVHKYARPEDVPERTAFFITTDGMENASRRFSRARVRKMIEEQKAHGWEFVFLGANIDAAETAGEIGIDREDAIDFICDAGGLERNFDAISVRVRAARMRCAVPAEWRASADDYYQKNRK